MKKNKLLIGLALLGSVLTLASCENKKDDQTNNEDVNEPKAQRTVYVSTTGSTESAGTAEDPMSFVGAYSFAQPGDTILLTDGVYSFNSRLELKANGEANNPIIVKPATEGTNIVFDFHEMPTDDANRGIQVYGNYWHFKNITVTGAGDNGMYIAGSHNIVEDSYFYDNRDTGLQIGRAYSDADTVDEWPSYNLIKNCTSFANYDDGKSMGENADGFAAKLTVGYGNVFDGCIAFRNSDDGWDLYAKEDSGNIGTVVLYNCVAFENGYLPYQIDRTAADQSIYKSYNTANGDGIGFKLGGSVMTGDVIMNNCIAFNNKLHGLSDNSNPGVIYLKNITSANNCAGMNDDGTVAGRGLGLTKNTSNNIDLARTNKSYNNFYGVLSYTGNQGEYVITGDNKYNTDAFKGSAAYSIFQPTFVEGAEVYKAVTGYEDISSWATDEAFSNGTDYTGLSDSSFASVSAINAVCESREKVTDLLEIAKKLRNSDNSVNMGDTLKVVDQNLLTFANGSAIGANLSKASNDEYEHYYKLDFSELKTEDGVKVQSAYEVLEVICDTNAVFQDFEVAKLIHGCNIEWTSSNPEVLAVSAEETISASTTVLGKIDVITPSVDTEVKLTAKISCGVASATKEFTLLVKGRSFSVGSLSSSRGNAIRVGIYEEYVAPRISVLDAASAYGDELPASVYDIEYSYRYATSRTSKYYAVDGVYTSAPGVYEVTATAVLKADPTDRKSMVYNVYVVDPDCEMDFVASQIMLTKNGFDLSANLSNIYGDIYAVVSNTELTITPEQLLNHENVQTYPITTDQMVFSFEADNSNVSEGTTQYYAYYMVLNKNKSNLANAALKAFSVDIVNIFTNEEMYELATTGKYQNNSPVNPTIYSLQNDLDFADYEWVVKTKELCAPFSGLLNGNGHTISNLKITSETEPQTANMFFKVSNGTIMNLNFNEIDIRNNNLSNSKLIGIVGDLQGGYLHNINITNLAARGREGVGGLVGQVTGGINYVSECSLINPIPADGEENKYIIAASNKYAAALIGNCQKNSDQNQVSLTVTDCMAEAVIGDVSFPDAGGNYGGILGRAKNETDTYYIDIQRCYFKGLIIAQGQYNAGILGDLDNGAGTIVIKNCFSDVIFNYAGLLLDVNNPPAAYTEKYAHKNSNPIIGRATKSAIGSYDTFNNYGTWKEYYSDYVISKSIIFDLGPTDDNPDIPVWEMTEAFIEKELRWSLDVWSYQDGIVRLK